MNPARILVVEDEFIVAKEIEMRIAAMGYQPMESALNAEEAMTLIEEHHPDLVLMDIHLQGKMDGITAAEEIRKRFRKPVIFVTAYSEDTTLERAKVAEPCGYILKPFEERELKSAIEIALYKHHAEREILRLNRLYDVLSQVSQAIVRTTSRDDLVQAICRIMVERGDIDLAWIGWLDPETAGIRPVAHWGRQEEVLSLAELHSDDRPEGQCNPGRAIREDQSVFRNECIRGECLCSAEFASAEFDFNSCGSFPIHFQGQVCGTLNLGIKEAGFFQKREIELLEEVAQNISFALDKLEGDSRRAQAEEALRKNEEQYRLLVETSNEGVWAMDRDHVTTYVNQAMAIMLGYKPSEIIGTKVEEYFFPEDLSFHQERMKKRHAGQDEVYELRFRRRDGSPLWTLVSSKVLKDDQGLFMGSFAMFTDITERKIIEGLNQDQHCLASALAATNDLNKGLALCLKAAITGTQLDSGGIYLVEERTGDLNLHAHLGLSREFIEATKHFDRTSPQARLVMIGKPHYGSFVELIRAPMEAERREGLRFLAVIPLCRDGRSIGCLNVASHTVEDVPPFVRRAIETIASEAAQAIVRLQAEAALHEEVLRRRTLMEQSRDGIVVLDRNGKVVETNRSFAHMLGYSMEEMQDLYVWDWDAKMTRRELEEAVRLIDASGDHFITRHRRRDGTVYDVEITSTAATWEDEKRIFCTCRDITMRKRDEEILSARLRLMEYATNHSLENLLQKTIDEAELITDSSIGFFHFLESDQRTISLQAWSGRTLNDSCRMEGKGLHYSLDTAGVWADCIRNRCPLVHNDLDGLPNRKGMPAEHARLVRELVVPVFRSEAIVAVLGIGNKSTDYGESDVSVVSQLADLAWDIAERKRAEEQILRLNDQNKMILGAVMEGIIGTDSEGNITFVNPSGAQILGYEEGELLGKPIHRTVHHSREDGTPYSEVDCPMNQAIVNGKSFSARDDVLWRKDGRNFAVSYTSAPILESDKIVGAVIGFRDITELKLASEKEAKLEAQLNHIQKMEAMGTLAGGIAHDFNNILSPIIGYTEMALDEIPESSPSRYDLEQVLTGANRAKELVKQILSFSRRGEEQLMRPVEMGLIAKEALKLLRASLPSSIEIRQDIHKVMVVADATQIHQIIVNLCTNAAHAMEDIGVLGLSLREVHLSAQDLVALSIADLRPGKHLNLSVKDTGTGMSPDTMQRIFDPYFTTKEVGKGTGLGLAVVHGIVKRHGGEILVKSEVGKGSVFDVFIPAVEPTLKREVAGSQVLPRGRERILLVDDESAIATMGTRTLEQLGYTVTARTSAKEALDLFRSQPDQFDLILTDYTMPQMVGTQLANECRGIRAEVPVIICTGHSERLNKEEPEQIGANAVAMKPLDRKQLAMLIREVLDKAQS